MKARDMATELVTKLTAISNSDEDDEVLAVRSIDAVEEFVTALLTEAHSRAGASIEKAMDGVRFDDGE
jgi:hypothetical protein